MLNLVRTLTFFKTKSSELRRTTTSPLNTTLEPEYCDTYPDITGKNILAKEPADAKYPNNSPF